MTRTVARALSIFDAFDRDHLGLTLQEIGERIGMSKATTFRLVNTLEREGYLVRRPDNRYRLSLKIVRLAGLVEDTTTVRDAARAAMQDLGRRTGETISLSSRIQDERVVIDVVDTPSPLMAVVRPGERYGLLWGASSRVLLAHMPERDQAEILDRVEQRVAELARSDISHVHRRGYCITHGQRVAGLSALAVPLYDRSNTVMACLALSGPTVRVEPREQEFVELLMEAGRSVSARLGKPG